MEAMVREAFGGPEQLVIKEVPTPVPQEGEVLIAVRAFGINSVGLAAAFRHQESGRHFGKICVEW